MATAALLRYRPLRWLLVDGDRLAVAGLTLAVMFGLLLAVDPFPSVTGPDATPLFYLFSALLGGNLNLLTVVVAINQLVYSREMNSTEQLRSEIAAIAELRDAVAEAADRTVAPVTPAGFVRLLLEEVSEDLEALAAELQRESTGRAATGVETDARRLVRTLGDQLDTAAELLTESHAKTVDVLGATLAIDFSAANHLASRVRERGGQEVSEQMDAALEAIDTRLEQLVLVRNHFESMYTQENLAQMSRQLLFIGVPVEFLLGLVLLWFVGLLSSVAPAAVPSVAIYTAMVLGLAPLAVVFAFVIRAVTIARQTAITNQFAAQRHADRIREEYGGTDDTR